MKIKALLISSENNSSLSCRMELACHYFRACLCFCKNMLVSLLFVLVVFTSCQTKSTSGTKEIALTVLQDKIAGGWAGKMLGVSYGGPTEFVAHGTPLDDSIKWKPSDTKFSITEDDIYVQLTFMMAMDQFGIDAPAKKFQELFAKSKYKLWHANVQARKNYFDSIFPPQSGSPIYNAHADDIDFQIEADYIGLICPAMSQTALEIADKIGHIMNYGDGVYGGVFVSALYTHAFFENDLQTIVVKALQSIPAESDYAKIINDVILLHKHYPNDWRKAWNELETKWADTDMCGAGSSYNIDAKFNGAYIVMGLLYGNGDPLKTMEISTRCGQDSDCNPSSAMGVLGVVKGFSHLPLDYQNAVKVIGDSIFDNTTYSFNLAVEKTMNYAKQIAIKNGGELTDKSLRINLQAAKPGKLEDSFPKVIFAYRESVFSNKNWTFKGNWQILKKDNKIDQARFSSNAGDEATFTFDGTGVSILGNWNNNCGIAEVYVDGTLNRTIDCYFDHAGQHPGNTSIFIITRLPQGKHNIKLVVTGKNKNGSTGSNIYLTEASVFKTAPKANENVKFSFQ